MEQIDFMRRFLYNDVLHFIEKVIASWSDIPGTTVTSHIISGCVDKTRSKKWLFLVGSSSNCSKPWSFNVSRRKELIPVPHGWALHYSPVVSCGDPLLRTCDRIRISCSVKGFVSAWELTSLAVTSRGYNFGTGRFVALSQFAVRILNARSYCMRFGRTPSQRKVYY